MFCAFCCVKYESMKFTKSCSEHKFGFVHYIDLKKVAKLTNFVIPCFSVPPNIIDSESSPSTVTIRENHNTTLTCSAEGTPQPRITWRREDGKKIIIKRKKNAGKKGNGKLYLAYNYETKILVKSNILFGIKILFSICTPCTYL